MAVMLAVCLLCDDPNLLKLFTTQINGLLSKPFDNIVEKKKTMACYKPLVLFPQCFQNHLKKKKKNLLCSNSQYFIDLSSL